MALAREAGSGDVHIAGGASVVRQALGCGVLDELSLDVVPVMLGCGERMFDADTRVGLDQVEVQHSAWATHLRYRIVP